MSSFPVSPSPSQPQAALWSQHWSAGTQRTLVQRFFSFWRKAVFARTVRYYFERFFPAEGVFLEAGAGTSETSMYIDKRGGRRVLVAADIVLPVLAHTHPVMDGRVAADIFRMPCASDSLDGVWNVGVMEHFLQDEIDAMLAELRRVLKPGAPLLMLWPGRDSIPQRMLRLVEHVIHRVRGREDFRFHPPEISQLRSLEEGREVLRRNGFDVVHIDGGLRSLFAFKILIGRKCS